MPNWCSTNITINYEDNDKLKTLYDLLTAWTSRDYAENGFGHNWLGNIVLGSRIGTVDTDAATDIRCRGSVSYMDVCDGQIIIDTETAWCPLLKMWKKIIDKYLPDAELIYRAEEPGMQLYLTNDITLNGTYYIDAWDCDEVEPNYEASESETISILQKLLSTDENNIDKLLDMYSQSDFVDSVIINKWEYDEDDSWWD